jgi:rare lipoprotein A
MALAFLCAFSAPLRLCGKAFWVFGLPIFLAACGTQTPRPVEGRGEAPPTAVSPAPTLKGEGKKPAPVIKYSGGFYKDDGPGDKQPEDIDAIPDAVPRAEPLHRFANNPYSVLGRDYVPLRDLKPYTARGIGSWYGRKFHGQKTSSGEPYDMYGMTAAHPTLPIPSYVRVSNPANGKSVVVRMFKLGFKSGAFALLNPVDDVIFQRRDHRF